MNQVWLTSKGHRTDQSCIAQFKNKGNTVVLVEHNPQLIREADFIIDIGPFAGEMVAMSSFQERMTHFSLQNLTSQALQEPLPLNDQPRKARKSLSIEHATLHNLNNLSVEVPLEF